MAAAWPTTAPSYPFDEEVQLSQIKSSFENGVVQSRPRYTRARDRWSLKWDYLPESQYQSFKEYFEANQGTTFTWTHPITSGSHTVRFMDDSLKSTTVLPGYRSVRIGIEEA